MSLCWSHMTPPLVNVLTTYNELSDYYIYINYVNHDVMGKCG